MSDHCAVQATAGLRRGWMWLALVCLVVGCETVPTTPSAEVPSSFVDSSLYRWEEGIRAFRVGEYAKAESVFQELSQRVQGEELCRKAIYALACTKFAAAQKHEQLRAARDYWDLWASMSPLTLGEEDPRMLSPLIERFAIPESNTNDQGRSQANGVQEPATLRGLVAGKEREIERLKSRLEIREKELQNLKGQIKRLRQQIDGLEKIHLEIQEKKREVSAQ